MTADHWRAPAYGLVGGDQSLARQFRCRVLWDVQPRDIIPYLQAQGLAYAVWHPPANNTDFWQAMAEKPHYFTIGAYSNGRGHDTGDDAQALRLIVHRQHREQATAALNALYADRHAVSQVDEQGQEQR